MGHFYQLVVSAEDAGTLESKVLASLQRIQPKAVGLAKTT